MAAGGGWASLPSVVLEHIFSKLSPKDRIGAASTCHRWREFMFLPQFWPVITFNLGYKGRPRSRFLSSKCAKFVREAIIEFNSTRSSQVWDCARLLELLSRNGQLECISLRPSNCYFDEGDDSLERWDWQLIFQFLNCLHSLVLNQLFFLILSTISYHNKHHNNLSSL